MIFAQKLFFEFTNTQKTAKLQLLESSIGIPYPNAFRIPTLTCAQVIHFFEQHGYRVLSISHFGKKQTRKQLEGNFRSFQEAKRSILNRISSGGTGLGLEGLELLGETHIWARL